MKKLLFSVTLLTMFAVTGFAQKPSVDYTIENEFEIGGITVSENENTDENAIIAISGLTVGKTIKVPGDDVPKAIKALWRLRLFTDIEITITKKIGNVIFLNIRVQERSKLSRYSYKSVKKSYHDDLNGEVDRYLLKGAIVTESVKINAINAINNFFTGKGYLDVRTTVEELPDSLFQNSIRLVFDVERGDRIKIADIIFTGNDNIIDRKLRKQMENTSWKKKIFSSSKMVDEDYETDKNAIIAFYNTLGFRDTKITKDSIYRDAEGESLIVEITIDEGNQYLFRDITWKGNSIYTNETLAQLLGISKGDIYNQALLDQRLQFSEDSRDVSSQYMDNGYLFFQVNPTELTIENDSVDLEIRIFEGPQATINNVTITGNDRTHEEVIRRELRTKPGQKFSRSDIIRSQREITNLGYFDPEQLSIGTPVNQQNGTVDIEYGVVEKSSDQLELSAGWGGLGRGVIGTLGVTFNNFSLSNIAKKETWSPLPQGDGQRLSLRGQTNGQFYQAYNFSFTEPWLGGKKPNSFTLAAYHTRFYRGELLVNGVFEPSSLAITGGSVGIGTRLKWPDDFFVSNTSITYQNINISNYSGFSSDGVPVTKGSFNNLSLNQTFSRNSIDNPTFPRSGSRITLGVQASIPYSLFRDKNTDYASMEIGEKFKWLEYHKWKIAAEWYSPVFDKFVFRASAKIGLLGSYNDAIGTIPFERFELGGDGISNFAGIQGKDIIALRGYDVNDLEANVENNQGGAAAYNKFTLELRYPISLNPMSTIYVLGFFEGGNAWNDLSKYDPFDLKRSTGLGLRVFLPMFGTLGFDYGIGFDKNLGVDAGLTEYGKFNIILGFEPE
ncbi:MAG: outer membrane protein insertion porin family [Cognaticolwellia sp.]|jgi:outer membrane protein insertion porin family